jgi:mannosyltransferase OCH1-like enzyme
MWRNIQSTYHNGCQIPQLFWMSVKTLPWNMPHHINSTLAMNPKWQLHVVNDSLIQQFMDHFYAHSGILWAYNHVHPLLGAVRADIWRYAVLYIYGVVFLDYDASLGITLDNYLQPHHTFITSGERIFYKREWCYSKSFAIFPEVFIYIKISLSGLK